jgi:hypothetical protein
MGWVENVPKKCFHAVHPIGVILVRLLPIVGRSTIHSMEFPTRVVPAGGFFRGAKGSEGDRDFWGRCGGNLC